MNQPCTIKGHEITRSFGEAKDGVVECDCICWSCNDPKDDRFTRSWTELWKFERVVKDKEPPL